MIINCARFLWYLWLIIEWGLVRARVHYLLLGSKFNNVWLTVDESWRRELLVVPGREHDEAASPVARPASQGHVSPFESIEVSPLQKQIPHLKSLWLWCKKRRRVFGCPLKWTPTHRLTLPYLVNDVIFVSSLPSRSTNQFFFPVFAVWKPMHPNYSAGYT